MPDKRGSSVSIEATKEQVFSIITDYGRYAEWAADCIHSQVLLKEEDIVVAEFTSPELMGGIYQLECVHTPPTSVIYSQIDQHGSKGLSGSWEITESDDDSGIILTGEMRLKTKFWKNLGNRRKTNMVLHRRLESIRDEVSYTYGSPEVSEGTEIVAKKKIAEVARRGENIEVWFLGEKYELRKIS